jgi:hypothetical protein
MWDTNFKWIIHLHGYLMIYVVIHENVQPNREGMLKSIGQTIKVNCSHPKGRVRDNLSALVGKVK